MAYFQGKRVWLAGASYGIGRALALELASRGATLGVTARSQDKLNSLRDQLKARGFDALVLPGDVTDAAALTRLVARMHDAWGGIDILIANAGTHQFTRPEQFDADEYLQLMDLNYGGALRCIEAVLPDMLAKRSGQIVGVASLAGYRALPRAAAYGASKAALHHFLDSIRFHLTEHGLAVTVISPGFVKTPLTDKNDFHMPFLVDADKAARIMCDGIAKRRDAVAFPIPFSWTIAWMRIIPWPIYKFIMRRVWKRMKTS